MMNIGHTARVAKIVEALRSAPVGEWTAVKVPCVGTYFVHRVPAAVAAQYGWNEMWVRTGSKDLCESTSEDRGSAEAIAKRLCLKLRAPSKAVQAAVDTITVALSKVNPFGDKGIEGLRAPEVAAMLGLDEETTYRALDHMAEQGLVKDNGDYGFAAAA